MKILTLLIILFLFLSCTQKSLEKEFKGTNLVFNELATVWDEAMPLGNGMVGNLVWQKDGKLRFSLDRADLWDLRPKANINFEEWKFNDVYNCWKTGNYQKVLDEFDLPSVLFPAPTKIPAGALEFEIEKLGEIQKVELDIEKATCFVEWGSGASLTTFVHAEKPLGWYKFENLPEEIRIKLNAPAYNRENTEAYTNQSRNDLNQLGYEQGEIVESDNSITYNQKGWNNFSYQIHTEWKTGKNSLTGCWSVSSNYNPDESNRSAIQMVQKELEIGIESNIQSHNAWWKNYWNRSVVYIPDSVLLRQYYLEMYKFGSVARSDGPPVSLQAVWTADHGKIPPWKGDFHHDLNTQLSYWPAYTGNYLDLEEGFVEWLWENKPVFEKYTKDYFEAEGLNVPGVTTLDGQAMGGWIQYSMGPTVSAWLAHHFYLHWKYTMDSEFLESRAYPWLKNVAVFLNEISIRNDNGERQLKMSSSPEIYNNSEKAWFAETTNFDLALIRWTYEKTAEMASELGLVKEAEKWNMILSEWPDVTHDETGLMFAPGFPYDESHRHFSHLMAYHPLGLIDYSNGKEDQEIIEKTLRNLEKHGSDYWTGYSFSWLGNLYAREFEGDKAARALTIFAECFCLKNSFHVNGDQCKAGHSKYTYRPFTLEGNFAYAAAIQEMLIQSHTGIVKLFPAIPEAWEKCSFEDLRTYGAFIVSAEMKSNAVQDVIIQSDKGGEFQFENPFGTHKFNSDKEFAIKKNIITIYLEKGETVSFHKV